jgi:hypothetical protein
MIVWDAMAAKKASLEKHGMTQAPGMLYQLAAVFPSLAGVMFAFYAIFRYGFGLSRLDAFKRLR